MAARTTKTAMAVGLVYGGLQDAVGVLRGRPIGYVDYLKRRFGGDTTEITSTATATQEKQERILS